VTGGERITRDDLEAELRSTIGSDERLPAGRRTPMVVAGVVAVVTVVAVAWLVGRRAGVCRSTVVEVRRI